MKVVSVNIGEPKEIRWRLRKVKTGIFKYPVNQINLESTDVESDHVIDRRYHGGIDKACYLFSSDAYPHFKALYPNLDWDWGMFGENVTVEGLDESQINIGDTYTLGTAIVEVSEPRQPCFKLGIRFGTQKVLKDFIKAEFSGVYLRVLKPGVVKAGDEMILEKKGGDVSIRDVFQLLYNKVSNPGLLEEALLHEKLAESTKKSLR